ncbi:abnormal spindle-like microcephaly-associated protein homolog [Manduca sexta]|uniref:Calponin-homology (CH) domain-containing protein n=1 Tax=Manduca sexta TaxID=7130 RepID=A0A921YUL9_MANSE|nr:abnormal spindle-like microcephaly-associated protein homolog [Manduca sexta]KAG6445889.1 hypothetical protein O3G_MSEX004150 [Manduca sexta]
MYFEIENTPEHIRKTRRPATALQKSPKEECPRLILAPFSRPPQVVFDNVLIGNACERMLEIQNPSKVVQRITLEKSLPPGLIIHLPEEWLDVEPDIIYSLTMTWTPMQPTASRSTIRFTNDNRGRYDVVVVLKSTLNIKGKTKQSKSLKVTPGKIKKKVVKKSPVDIYKRKMKKTSPHKLLQTYNKENISTITDYSIDTQSKKCPFDSPTSIELNFNTSEIFSNVRKPNLHDTYDRSYGITDNKLNIPQNVLKPFNKQTYDNSATDIFDNVVFTPLKSLKTVSTKTEKLEKGPKIILSVNSESDFDDSLDLNTNKENETHSIVSITSAQPNKWLTVNTHYESQFTETPTIPNKKQPNTSSPKELNNPDFSINTEFSRISELSFLPQRFSTERKCFAKFNNETHDVINDIKLNSDTYTKDSPNTPVELNFGQFVMKPPYYFMKEQQPKMCRQALFREYNQQREIQDKFFLNQCDQNVWQNNLRTDVRSPPRSITPPLQSIPEESAQISDIYVLDKTDKRTSTFTINRTFDKNDDKCAMSASNRQSWSKKAVRAEPDLWKIPVSFAKKSLKSRTSIKSKDSLVNKPNVTFESNKSINQNISVNMIGNVYSQSTTVDPFLSTSYFYDEGAVEKFETEFKRWLNYILTPPADLDSNVEQKIDVGKAWIENRNKEIPAAPTKEQVSSAYHNSHRLEGLRRSARNLLLSADIAQVFLKLNAQIEKKLIAIRNDRNLHLDIGLQKIIMELLLSYNPLWLRIGLEAIYRTVLPLRSNSDIEGLTTFIIQRMFKNPFLKNKHSKSSAPNMLLPAYMEAIKKFTLKKFFMLVFFLDQAKQKKLIPHDPCLFCRNAVCKESREIVIRFTRELIAGIGDVTKHLRPLGYVLSHKQSYLDEYKYAVHNIAVDIRDGVRLTKVMEIILMRNGLLNQLRTPAISRLQKIHNVHVALNALKEANFVIFGDITPTDIADGHREKTLSLLWQIIHVFRAPLFEKAANVIQAWWRKKYEVIVEKRKEEERVLHIKNEAASIIQRWWRKIQYDRLVEWEMQRIITATIIIQKFCRMWLCRTHYQQLKCSVLKIETWYKSAKLIREAKMQLQRLQLERKQLEEKSATTLQRYVRRWLCMRQYKSTVTKVIIIQSNVRRFLVRREYIRLKKSVIYVQQKYRSKQLMKRHIKELAYKRRCAIIMQSYYKMMKQRKAFLRLKNAVRVTEDRYIALVKMRKNRQKYVELKRNVISMQALYRRKKCRQEYLRKMQCIILLQRKFRAQLFMKKERANYLRTREAAIVIQKYIRSYLYMKNARKLYVEQRKSVILIQKYYRSYIIAKTQRTSYVQLRKAAITLQRSYRSLVLMRQHRNNFLNLKKATVTIQRRFRGQMAMKKEKENYDALRKAALVMQRRYRAQQAMRKERSSYLTLRSSCIVIQRFHRACVQRNIQRHDFLKKKVAAIKIQTWFRSVMVQKQVRQEYEQTKTACVLIQRVFRSYIMTKKIRTEYVKLRTATIIIQKYFRCYIEMKTAREQYSQLKTATVTIQKFYRSYLETKKQRKIYLQMKSAVSTITSYYRRHKEFVTTRQRYLDLRKATTIIQIRYRSLIAMREHRSEYLKLRKSSIVIQQRYKAFLAMRKERAEYLKLRAAAIILQRLYKANSLMKFERNRYLNTVKACVSIQSYFRAYLEAKKQREYYLSLKNSTVVLQNRYRALLSMRKARREYLQLRSAVVVVQTVFRAKILMKTERITFLRIVRSCITIQRHYRGYVEAKRQRENYLMLQQATVVLQRRYRALLTMREIRRDYLQLRSAAVTVQTLYKAMRLMKIERTRYLRTVNACVTIQRHYRAYVEATKQRESYSTLKTATVSLQRRFRALIIMRQTRREYLQLRSAAITIQTMYRGKVERNRYLRIMRSSVIIQRFYRGYVATKKQRQSYLALKAAAVVLQRRYRALCAMRTTRTIYLEYLKQKILRESAAICIQKNVRRYLQQSWYRKYCNMVILIQRIWRGKLHTRLIRCMFLQKRRIVISVQAIARGYLVRKQLKVQRENVLKVREEQRRNWAASKIQALFRGHKVREAISHDRRVTELRLRWRQGGLNSDQETLKERNEEVMHVLRNMCDIETVIRAFRSLELLTEVFPMMYNDVAASIVRRVYVYMSVTNRSISSIEVLKSAAAVLVNLTRYRFTGPKIYARHRIPAILKFMFRFSNSETQLFCILATYLWLFAKYDGVREDLKEYFHESENHKMLISIKRNIDRMKRMACNVTRNKQPVQNARASLTHSFNQSISSTGACRSNSLLPALEPDYGIIRADKPRYFVDAQQAIDCLFYTYAL